LTVGLLPRYREVVLTSVVGSKKERAGDRSRRRIGPVGII